MRLRFFQPQNAIFAPGNAFSSDFSGFPSFQQPRIHTVVKIGAKLWLLPQSQNGLGAKHRRVRNFKTMKESFPKTIPLWSPKIDVPCNENAERLFATRDGGTEGMGQDSGLITTTPVHFVLLRNAGPEKGEPSLGVLSDLLRSVTATSHMKYAFSSYPLRK